jgi:general stress protein YciG
MTEKSKRGFASMDPQRQREIASKGGRAAHAKGTAHEWSKDEARQAGHKGGVVVSRDREHMSMIGREGGEARSRLTAGQRHGAPRRFVERESGMVLGSEVSVEPGATRGYTEVPAEADRPTLQARGD